MPKAKWMWDLYGTNPPLCVMDKCWLLFMVFSRPPTNKSYWTPLHTVRFLKIYFGKIIDTLLVLTFSKNIVVRIAIKANSFDWQSFFFCRLKWLHFKETSKARYFIFYFLSIVHWKVSKSNYLIFRNGLKGNMYKIEIFPCWTLHFRRQNENGMMVK